MKELINKVEVTGKLVKKEINDIVTKKKGEDAISGIVVLRTADNSEHEIRLFAKKFKQDTSGNATTEISYFYNEYNKLRDNAKDIAEVGYEAASVVASTNGNFEVNDYVSEVDKKIKTVNNLSGRFLSIVEDRDIASTPMVSKFEVEGIIASIADEIRKEIPTGRLIVSLNAIRQTATKNGKTYTYEVDSFTPLRLIVSKDMVDAFKTVNYYEGCFTKFVGILVNTKEIIETVEKQSFGEDKIDRKTITNRMYEIKSGSLPSAIFEHELDQVKVDALIAKRKQHLTEVASGKTSNTPSVTAPSTPAPATTYNPFAQKQ